MFEILGAFLHRTEPLNESRSVLRATSVALLSSNFMFEQSTWGGCARSDCLLGIYTKSTRLQSQVSSMDKKPNKWLQPQHSVDLTVLFFVIAFPYGLRDQPKARVVR